jgi:hypothetical protein
MGASSSSSSCTSFSFGASFFLKALFLFLVSLINLLLGAHQFLQSFNSDESGLSFSINLTPNLHVIVFPCLCKLDESQHGVQIFVFVLQYIGLQGLDGFVEYVTVYCKIVYSPPDSCAKAFQHFLEVRSVVLECLQVL